MKFYWHVFHIIMCLATSLLWTPVYIICALEGGKKAREDARDQRIIDAIRESNKV